MLNETIVDWFQLYSISNELWNLRNKINEKHLKKINYNFKLEID